MKNILLLIFVIGLLTSCKKSDSLPPIDNFIDLDGTTINDSSILYPEKFLISKAYPSYSFIDKSKPVLIAVHGFSATTFEWLEYKDFLKTQSDVLISLVLLGGHGRDYSDFKKATWEDWQKPIIEEYNALKDLGFTNISFIGSSTGCPLILEIIHANKIVPDVLKNVFLIDPIVVPSTKTLSLISAVGPALGYSETTMEKGENGYWYKYRPYQALEQLNTVTQLIQKNLEDGITLPSNTKLTVYKSKKDDVADPISSVLIQKGVKSDNNQAIEINIVESELHVFTRLNGRNVITDNDYMLQNDVFNKILSKIKL